MEDWVRRALAKWPNVPALFGWLGLDRRGRWLIRGEVISRPQIIETINCNYAADEHGRWYFQNGPQRGYMQLEYAPFVLRRPTTSDHLETHTGLPVSIVHRAALDEHGNLALLTDQGAGLLAEGDLDWALQRLRAGAAAVDEVMLAEALSMPGGSRTALSIEIAGSPIVVERVDEQALPAAFGFDRDPRPRPGEGAGRSDEATD